MDKGGKNSKFPTASNVTCNKVDAIHPNPKSRSRLHGNEDSPKNCSGSNPPRQFYTRSDKEKEKNSFDGVKTTSGEDGSDDSPRDWFENLIPLTNSGLDDPLVFDSDSEGLDEKVDVRNCDQARLSVTDSESDEEELRPAAEIEKVCDTPFAGERYDPFSDSESEFYELAEFAAKDFKISKEAVTEQEMTFTDSESEDEESEPAADDSTFKIQVQTEKEAMTFTGSESESEDEELPNADTNNGSKSLESSGRFDTREEMTFTDSESEDEESEPAAYWIAPKIQIQPGKEPMMFTDSESEYDLPSVVNETEIEKLPAAQFKASKEESKAECDLVKTQAQQREQECEVDFIDSSESKPEDEMTFTDSESEDEEPPIADINNSKISNHPSQGTDDIKDELTFTDSESEDEQPTVEDLVEKASDVPHIEELTFTDSESEDEQPTVEDLVEKASDVPHIEELTFTDSESEEGK